MRKSASAAAAVLIAAAFSGAFAVPAQAANDVPTVSLSNGTLRVTVDPASTLGVYLQLSTLTAGSEQRFQVYNEGMDLTAGDGCDSSAPDLVICPASGVTSYAVGTGSGNDHVSASDISIDGRARLGLGNDSFVFGPGREVVEAGSGSDTAMYFRTESDVSVSLDGVANDGEDGESDNALGFENIETADGDDTLIGNASMNRLIGGKGADVMSGRQGLDTASYSDGHLGSDHVGVTVSLDDVANDGEDGEGDNVSSDIENIDGTYDGTDELIGNDARNRLDGKAGPDTLDGGSGNDVLVTGGWPRQGATLVGGSGADTADYSRTFDGYGINVSLDNVANDGAPLITPSSTTPGNDNVRTDVENVIGGAGDDFIVGSSLANVLSGGAGDDRLNAASGNDRLSGGLGADLLDGGTGTDTVTYADRTSGGVLVRLDNVADDGSAVDGPAGDRDDVRSTIENVIGGGGNDRLIGSAVSNWLYGQGGVDRLFGMAGADVLYAQDGVKDAVINGGSGSDAATVDDIDPVPIDVP